MSGPMICSSVARCPRGVRHDRDARDRSPSVGARPTPSESILTASSSGNMNTIQTTLPGVVIIEPKVFGDARGFFMETWNRPRYEAAGLPGGFIQDNLSLSRKGVLRGLHYQKPFAQGKLLAVIEGEIFDVAADIRR